MALSLSLQTLAHLLSRQSPHHPPSLDLEDPELNKGPILAPNLAALPVTDIVTDTRIIKPGDVFLALKGETFDGHQFVAQALQKGAIAAIVNSQSDVTQSGECTEGLLLPVRDTLTAYQAIARWWRHQCRAAIVAVTGSVGKTTTKELIAALLSRYGKVLKTQANYNNEIGVPKTLLELTPDHEFAVIEMGMRGPGEIALLSQIAEPDVAVITNVGTAHIGRLGSEAAIAQAKCELLAEMPSSATAVLNADNPLLMQTAAGVWSGPKITFGLEAGEVTGMLLDGETLQVEGLPLPLPLAGRHNALNFLSALAVARALRLDWTTAQTRLEVSLPGGRARKLTLPNDLVLLDETYNAGVESMSAALHLLAETPGQRHIAVLGTMKELGDRSVDLHHQVGTVVQALHLDYLLTLADAAEADALVRGAGTTPAEQFTTAADLSARLLELLQPGDRVLFKASRAVALDQVVQQVQAQLTNAP